MSGDCCVVYKGNDDKMRVEYGGKLMGICEEVIVERQLRVMIWLVNEGDRDDLVELDEGDYLKFV
jgi:hypothetical protein